MEDLPNGFLNYPKKRPGFESAGDAIRRAQREAEYGRTERTDYRESQKRALSNGWRVAQDDDLGLFKKREEHNVWGADNSYRKGDLLGYLDVPNMSSGERAPVFNFKELGRIGETDRRWSWIEIDLGAIQNNIMSIRSRLAPQTMMLAVVKADGYGHGAIPAAKTALNSGASYIGVATIDEAIELREAGIDAPMLILSQPPLTTIPMLLAYHVMPSVTTAEFAIKYAEAADQIGMKAPYHLKLNTGMNRVGVRFDEAIEFLQTVSFHRSLDLVGTFTHFATADCQDTMDFLLQKQRFEEALEAMRTAGIDPGIVHAANSAAAIRYPDVQYDMVRLGLAMYGYYPCPETFGMVTLIPAMSVKARITQVNQVPVGEGVSYGLLHRSAGFAKTCTVPIGYADGLCRRLSGKISFIMNGRMHRQVGNICMDQCMFEVDIRTRRSEGKADPQIGDEVTIVGQEGDCFTTIDQMADILDTIPYELVINFGNSRMPKLYI